MYNKVELTTEHRELPTMEYDVSRYFKFSNTLSTAGRAGCRGGGGGGVHVIFFFTRPPPFFLLHFILAYFSFLFLCVPLCSMYLEDYKLVATSFPPPGSSAFPLTSLPAASKTGSIDL